MTNTRRKIQLSPGEVEYIVTLAQDTASRLWDLSPDCDEAQGALVVVRWLESLHEAVTERAADQLRGQLRLL